MLFVKFVKKWVSLKSLVKYNSKHQMEWTPEQLKHVGVTNLALAI